VSLKAGTTPILSDFNLTVYPGEKVLLFGPSGTGKSTILKSFYGFFPVKSGDLLFKGKVLDKRAFWEVRKEVAYVPQNLDIGEGPVRPLVKAVFSYRGNTGTFDEQEMARLLEYFELGAGIFGKNFEDLSGGEKQRIGIVISLLSDREIYFLDEITSSLDADLKEKVITYYLTMESATELIISHDPEWEGRDEVRIIRFDEHSRPPLAQEGPAEQKENP
jgi:putative ABC transport system ATP-binding protein